MTKKNQESTSLTVEENKFPTSALAEVENYDEFAGDGDKLGSNDLLMSRYRCVQLMSRAKKNNRELSEGMFYSTLTGRGHKRALVVPVFEKHHVIEKTDDSTTKFVRELELNDPRVVKALKANNQSFIKLRSVDANPPTKVVETRDVYVVFLDETDGVTPQGYGVLQFDSSNLTPCVVWKNDRHGTGTKPDKNGRRQEMPSYAFRSVITCETKDNSKSGNNDSQIFKIEPFRGSWLDGSLKASDPQELALLRMCKEHKRLIVEGKFKVDTSDTLESEDAQEDAAFSPEDDGRDSSVDAF